MERPTRWALASALTVYLCIAAAGLVSLPWKGTADSLTHLDYVYQMSHGTIPEPYGSAYSFPGSDRPVIPDGERQFASAHPPLFYALAAPVMGPLLDSGHWVLAVAAGRLLNLSLGGATFLVLAWFGWTFGGRYRSATVLAVPLTGTLVNSFLRFSGDIYNDMLVAFVSTLALVGSAVVIRDGATRGRLIFLSAVAAAGMASKATFLVTFGVIVVSVICGHLLHGTGGALRRLLGGLLRTLPVLLAPVVAIGWFYVRNYSLSGSPVRSTVKAPLQGRAERTLIDNLTNIDFYLIMPRGLLGNIPLPPGQELNYTISLGIVAASLAMVVAVLAVRLHHGRKPSLPSATIAAILGLQLLGLQVAQLYHSVGFGAYNIRYFLPGVLQIGILLAAAWVPIGRWSALMLPTIALTMAIWFVVGTNYYLAARYSTIVDSGATLGRMAAGAAANGFPSWLPAVLLVAAGAGLGAVGRALWSNASGPALPAPADHPAKVGQSAGSHVVR